jgi:hypothetical protein
MNDGALSKEAVALKGLYLRCLAGIETPPISLLSSRKELIVRNL